MSRRLKTLVYLLGATLLSGVEAVFEHTLLFLFTSFACVFFGVGMVISNYNYRRYAFSGFVTIIAFIIIFLWGTIPFFYLGTLVFDNVPDNLLNYASFAFGVFGGFLLCFLTVIICYKGILVNWITIFLMIALPFASFELVQIPLLKKLDRLISAIIIFQPLLTLIIVASIKSENLLRIDKPKRREVSRLYR